MGLSTPQTPAPSLPLAASVSGAPATSSAAAASVSAAPAASSAPAASVSAALAAAAAASPFDPNGTQTGQGMLDSSKEVRLF